MKQITSISRNDGKKWVKIRKADLTIWERIKLWFRGLK